MQITAIYGSPRKGGNTDLLMQSYLCAVREQGLPVREIFLRDLTYSPCIECGGCNETGACVLRDDMAAVYPALTKSEIIILAAPVFFYGLNALAKAMVDRTQCLWAKKYLLKQSLSAERGCAGRGILLSAGGSKGLKNFDGMLLTVRYFFDALDMPFAHHLTFSGIDTKGAAAKHPTALEDAYKLGETVLSPSDRLF